MEEDRIANKDEGEQEVIHLSGMNQNWFWTTRLM